MILALEILGCWLVFGFLVTWGVFAWMARARQPPKLTMWDGLDPRG